MNKLAKLPAIVGPGILVAATGVGAGDLATGSFSGSILGTAILWAVVIGAILKFVVTEGIARWQLATGTSVIEGMRFHLGPISIWIFLPYLVLWSFFVGSAMMSACGVALHALFPVFEDPANGKIFFGIISSFIGAWLIYHGGYQLFEKLMGVCIGIMFIAVVLTALLMWPGFETVLRGIFIPTIPDIQGQGLGWTIALIGGIGGTVSVLSYGYWIKEEGRTSGKELGICRIDLATGYIMTALFGLSVVIIGSNMVIEGSGATLLINLSDQLGARLGPAGKWLFLIGALGAVCSSLLGVWQSTPYFFTDCWKMLKSRENPAEQQILTSPITETRVYKVYLLLLATIPILGLFTSFRELQKIYAITGAFFFPYLALLLLLLNNPIRRVGIQYRNGMAANIALIAVLLFFTWAAIRSFVD